MGRETKRGLILVVSAPSGCGKTSLVERLIKSSPDIIRSVSVTTRGPRKGERRGRDYRFVSKTQFQKLKNTGKLLESARVFDEFYGTPLDFIKEKTGKGKTVVLTIDVQGALQVKRKRADAVLVFVLPPSTKELERRLSKRSTERAREVKRRLKKAQWEIAHAKFYDYVIINDRLSLALSQLKAIAKWEKNLTR